MTSLKHNTKQVKMYDTSWIKGSMGFLMTCQLVWDSNFQPPKKKTPTLFHHTVITDRVNFLHSSSHGDVSDQHSETTALTAHPCFQLMLSNNYCSTRVFLARVTTLGMGKKLGGDATRTADLKRLITCCDANLWHHIWWHLMAFVFPSNYYEWWIPLWWLNSSPVQPEQVSQTEFWLDLT